MVVGKLIGLTFSTLLFFWLFVFGPFYDQMTVQIGVLAAVLLLNSFRHGIRDTLNLLKFCLPFVLCLFFFGLIFHFTQLFGRRDWLTDTLIKCMIFPSSLIFLQIMLSFVSYLDLLSLPLAMKRRIDLISVKAAFQKGSKVLGRFTWYLSTYSGLKSERRIRFQLTKYACLIIALYLYLYEEIEDANRLLNNRQRHLHGLNE
jgi:uncharacterized membrane protein